MLGINRIKTGAGNGSVRVSNEPARHKVVQVIRYRSEGNRFVSRQLVNFLREDGRGGFLRLRIGARELQTRCRELTTYFSEKPGACSETTNQKDELFQSRQRQSVSPGVVSAVTVFFGSKSPAMPLMTPNIASRDGLKNFATCALCAAK